MRLLTVHGFCDETGVRQYRSNANAELLNTPGMEGATRNMFVLLWVYVDIFADQEADNYRTSGLSSYTPSVVSSSLYSVKQNQQGKRHPIFKPLIGTRLGLHYSNT